MISRFVIGNELTVAAMNEIVDALNALQNLEVHPAGNAPARWIQGGVNTVLAFDPSRLGSGDAIAPGGFKCEKSSTLIRVYYAAVSGVTPAGMIFGDVPPFTVTPVGGSGVVCLAVTAGDTGDGIWGAVSAEVACFGGMPSDGSPDNTYYLQLGSYNTSGGGLVVTPGGMGNGVGDQIFVLCGGEGGTPEWGPA